MHCAQQKAALDKEVDIMRSDSSPPEAFVVDTAGSPHAALRPVPLDAVQFTGGFWKERLDQAVSVTARELWRLLVDANAGHVLQNFRIAAGLAQGEFAGTHWQDAWLYKWIEAAACLYRLTGDQWLDARMDEGIDLIARAQASDGYIATQTQARNRPRFQNPRHHEMYTMGHLLTAAAVHYRMTGKTSFLDIARRTADFLYETLGVDVPGYFAHNPSVVMGLVELYRVTGDSRYLACAQRVVDQRGTRPKSGGLWERPPGLDGTDQIQDRVPLRKETEVVGHNVFFTYLYAGAADLVLETGEQTLWTALDRLWHDLMERKINVNGGVSPMGAGLSIRNDPVIEAVGAAWFLPNASAYNETCGQVGNVLWNYRMLLHRPEVRFADVIEHEWYNGILSGIGLDGCSWWYRNPLRRYAPRESDGRLNDLPEREKPGRRRICCPTNLLRTVAQVGSYFYSVAPDTVWVQQYGASRAAFNVPSAGADCGDFRIEIEQQTDYPWEGEVRIVIREAPPHPISLRLRMPGWTGEAVPVAVNGEPVGSGAPAGDWAVIRRTWRAGDELRFRLPMSPRLIEAHPRAEHLRNQVAVMRGPILYCLESPDLPPGTDWTSVYIPNDVRFEAVRDASLPFSPVVLEGEALYRDEPRWDARLYREIPSSALRPLHIRLIPYFAWANRGPSAMSVWLPIAWRT